MGKLTLRERAEKAEAMVGELRLVVARFVHHCQGGLGESEHDLLADGRQLLRTVPATPEKVVG